MLRELGTPTHIGENGRGLVLKLAINISLGMQMLAFGKGLLLAERSGIDREIAAAEMAASAIGSPMLNARVPLVLDLPDEAWFDVGKMQKEARGYGERDIAALFEVLRELAGSEPVRAGG